jgi:hypothetical protein
MSWILTCGLLAMSGTAAAQELAISDVTYPKLVRQAGDAADFVPAGWKLEIQRKGDLNADGRDDLLIVLRQDDPNNILKHDGLGEDSLDTNPRILAAALSVSKTFRLAMQNHSLIPRHINPTLEDALGEGGVSIDRGGILVQLNFFASAGSWETFNATYRLKYHGGRFELIGYDKHSVHRATGEANDISINYLTRTIERGKGSIESDATTVTKAKLKRAPSLTLEKIGDGLDFNPLPE